MRIHVAIGHSATGSLRIAFGNIGHDEEVLCLADDLAMGPLTDPAARTRWLVDEAGWEIESSTWMDDFWQRVTALDATIVVWMSRRSAMEYCGLLELLWRVGDAPVSVVDVADVDLHWRDGRAMPGMSSCFGFVTDTEIVGKNLLDRAAPVSMEARRAYRTEWERLRRENTELRILTSTGVVSVPSSHFDDVILACVTHDWQKIGGVVGGALGKVSSDAFRQISNDIFFCERLLTLIEDAVVEGRRDEEHWSYQTSWVRLPTAS